MSSPRELWRRICGTKWHPSSAGLPGQAGDALRVTCALSGEPASAGERLLRAECTGPDGSLLPALPRLVRAPRDRADLRLFIPLNATPGTLRTWRPPELGRAEAGCGDHGRPTARWYDPQTGDLDETLAMVGFAAGGTVTAIV